MKEEEKKNRQTVKYSTDHEPSSQETLYLAQVDD